MKKWMNPIFFVLFVVLVLLGYKYFTSLTIEPDNTSMNNDDNITYSIDQYEPTGTLNYSFMNNQYDFSFNTVELQNMGNLNK